MSHSLSFCHQLVMLQIMASLMMTLEASFTIVIYLYYRSQVLCQCISDMVMKDFTCLVSIRYLNQVLLSPSQYHQILCWSVSNMVLEWLTAYFGILSTVRDMLCRAAQIVHCLNSSKSIGYLNQVWFIPNSIPPDILLICIEHGFGMNYHSLWDI